MMAGLTERDCQGKGAALKVINVFSVNGEKILFFSCIGKRAGVVWFIEAL